MPVVPVRVRDGSAVTETIDALAGHLHLHATARVRQALEGRREILISAGGRLLACVHRSIESAGSRAPRLLLEGRHDRAMPDYLAKQ